MDPIRPLGPIERDLEPVERVTRLSPDARREPREKGEESPPKRREPPPQPPPPDGEDGPSLIDIRV